MEKLAEMYTKIQLSDHDLAQMRAAADSKIRRDLDTNSQRLNVIPRQTPDSDSEPWNTNNFNPSDPNFLEMMTKATKTPYPAPTTLPCANVQPTKHIDCQTAHWKLHKQDCRNPMRLEGWQPGWAREGRSPSFITDEKPTATGYLSDGPMNFSAGVALWGNSPAMDVINFEDNENNFERDFSLAFVASGDLRNVLRTLNNLPPDYSGNLNILLNDIAIPIVCRNIVLLLIIGNIPDEAEAADIALHFWYSIFMPKEYQLRISGLLASFISELTENEGSPIRLGPCSTLYLCLTQASKVADYLEHFVSNSFTIEDTQNEYDRVKTAPSRRDLRDRIYAKLKPSHRVAFEEYQRFGILLPFGAVNSHFNCPNTSLFTLQGQWWQTDFAGPLNGWDIGTVITTGKRYGATTEDIYGCLYFFLSEQLRTSARRLRTTVTTFTALCMDARIVPKGIKDGVLKDRNIPSSIRFDRIVVSNILDANYVGIEDVLTPWAPLLADTKTAAIVGYFMNWSARQEDGRISGADSKTVAAVAKKVMERSGATNRKNTVSDPRGIKDLGIQMIIAMSDADVLYENSGPFSRFLQAEGINRILQKTKLKLREEHTIFPHRLLTPIRGPANALPEFPDDDAWYNYTKLSGSTWAERFVEFERA